jgi:hypothetical protein
MAIVWFIIVLFVLALITGISFWVLLLGFGIFCVVLFIVALIRRQEMPAQTMMDVVEFRSAGKYESWLQRMGDQVRILNVSTTKRWSLWTGFLGDTKTFTVTYEQISKARPQSAVPPQPPLNPAIGHCNSCGLVLHVGSRFCSSCGATVEPRQQSGAIVQEPKSLESDAKYLENTIAGCTSAAADSGPVGGRGMWWLVAIVVVVVGLIAMASRMQTTESGTSRKLREAGLPPDFCKQFPDNSICVSLTPPTSPESTATSPHAMDSVTTSSAGGPSNSPSPAISIPKEKPPDRAPQKAAKSETAVPPATPPSNQGNKEEDAAALKKYRDEWIRNTQQELWRQDTEMTIQARGTTLYVKYVLAGDAFAFQFGETFLGQNGATLKTLGFKKVYLSNGETGWTFDLSRY